MKVKPIVLDPEFDQLSFYTAVQEIKQHRGMTTGMAQKTLRELCASGEVRSWRQPYSMVGGKPQGEGPPERIEPVEWHTRQIDLMTDADGCSYWVDVNVSDFRGWLNQQPRPKRKPSQGRRKVVGKRPLIKELLAQKFLNGRVPDPPHCMRKELLQDLRNSHPQLKSLDDETLKAAIEEYNGAF